MHSNISVVQNRWCQISFIISLNPPISWFFVSLNMLLWFSPPLLAIYTNWRCFTVTLNSIDTLPFNRKQNLFLTFSKKKKKKLSFIIFKWPPYWNRLLEQTLFFQIRSLNWRVLCAKFQLNRLCWSRNINDLYLKKTNSCFKKRFRTYVCRIFFLNFNPLYPPSNLSSRITETSCINILSNTVSIV